MKKIIFVITKSNWGGAQRYVWCLAASLPKNEFDVAVALGGTGAAGSEPGELAARLKAEDIRILPVGSFARDVSLFGDVRTFFELKKIFRDERPDIVHLNSSKAGGVGALAARLAGVKKIIFTSHGLAWDEDRNPPAKALIYIFSRLTFLLCHRVITISHDNFRRARACWLCRKKIVLIHNGLPELQFETRERARISLALKAGLTESEDGGAFWIGAIAELTRNKGLAYLIGAAKLLEARGATFHLFIIGSGEEEPSLRKQIAENGLEKAVHLAGFVSDAYRFDKAFDCFVLSSVKEGLPTVLLEAGQAGIPVVATNIPGARDIVEHGITGLLALPRDPADLAAQIAALMGDASLRSSLAENLQRKVAAEFSIDTMIGATQKLYLA